MVPVATHQRLARSVRDAARSGAPIARPSAFHDSVREHVRARRAAGAMPETVLVEVKQLVR